MVGMALLCISLTFKTQGTQAQFCPIAYNTPEGSSSYETIVQTFTPMCTGLLNRLQLFVLGSNPFTVRILSGCANGNLLGEVQVASQQSTLVEVALPSIPVTAGVEYAIYIPVSGNAFIINAFNTYANGMLLNGDCTPVLSGARDLRFNLLYASTLPVNLNNFYGSVNDLYARLYWHVSEEKNLNRYEIERATSDLTFALVGIISAKNISGAQLYSYTDSSRGSMAAENYFYRLKIIDRDGQYSYSKVIVLKNEPLKEKISMRILSNPVLGQMQVEIYSLENGSGELSILTTDGQCIKSKIIPIQKGRSIVEWNVMDLPRSAYFLHLKHKKVSQMERVLKL